MTGAERVLPYRVAIETGLLANELRELTRGSLVLDATRPYIVAAAGTTKNRKRTQQYISQDVAAQLRSHVARKTPSAPLVSLPDKWNMADMLREDVDAARQAWLDEAGDEVEERIRREQTDFLLAIDRSGKKPKQAKN